MLAPCAAAKASAGHAAAQLRLLGLRCSLPRAARPRQAGAPSQRGRRPVSTAAAAPSIVPAFNWQATGVPLVESFMALSMREAAAQAAGLLVTTAVGVALGQRLLNWCEEKLSVVAEHTRVASGLDLLVKTGLVAVHRPLASVLPLLAANYALLVIGALLETAVFKYDDHIHSSLHICGHWAVQALKALTQLLQDSTELLMILLAAWFLLAWKARFVEEITERLSKGLPDGDESSWSRIIVPVSSLLSWGIVGAATAMALVSVGIDVRPLLAFGSVSSLVVGFAAQNTISNFMSAMALYTSTPFIKGDRIQLKSLSGSTIVAGVVEKIQPLRTVIRTDGKVPVYINNKDVASLMIVNESQQQRSSVRPGVAGVDSELIVRYEDMDKLEAIEAAITEYVNACDEIETGAGKCALAGFTVHGPVLALKASIRQSMAGKASTVRAKLLRNAERIIREHGAALSTLPINQGSILSLSM